MKLHNELPVYQAIYDVHQTYEVFEDLIGFLPQFGQEFLFVSVLSKLGFDIVLFLSLAKSSSSSVCFRNLVSILFFSPAWRRVSLRQCVIET